MLRLEPERHEGPHEPETKSSWLIDHVDDSCRIKRPQAKRLSYDSHKFARTNGRVSGKGIEPAEIKLLPTLQADLGSMKNLFAGPKSYSGMIDDVARRYNRRRSSRIGIVEIESSLGLQEGMNDRIGRLAK